MSAVGTQRRAAPAAAVPGRRAAFACLFFATFACLVAVGALLPVLPRYVHGPLRSGDVAVGVVIGSYAIAGLLVRPLAGRMAARRGRKPALLAGAALCAASGLLYLPGLGIAGLIVARLILGAGEGTLYTAGSSWAIDLAPPGRRGRVLGLYGLAVWSGFSVGPLAGELLLDVGGYEAVWAFAAAMPAAGALLVVRAAHPFRPVEHAEPHPLIAPEALRPGAAIALAALGQATVSAFVVLHLEARGVGHGASVFAVLAAAIVIARLVLGDLPDRAGAARVAAAAAVVEAVGLALLAVAHGIGPALLGAVLIGGAFALLPPSLMLLAVDGVADRARGAVMGTFTACFDAGVGLGAPLAGLVAFLTDYEGAFLFGAAMSLLGALISLTLHRRAAA